MKNHERLVDKKLTLAYVKMSRLSQESDELGSRENLHGKKIVHYVTRGESSRFFPRVGLLPERQEFSRECVYYRVDTFFFHILLSSFFIFYNSNSLFFLK